MTNNDDGTSLLPDRISSLPDDILCRILSFVPTKFAVRTRILSTRWKYLYSIVHVLDFDSTADDMCPAKQGRFEEFASRVLMTCNVSQITKISLNFDRFSISPDHFLFWMSSVLCRNVLEIDIIHAVFSVPHTLPSELLSSRLLSVLKLDGDFYLKLPSSAFLPSLKALHLRNLCFDDSAGRIVSICPILENLLLDDCDFENLKVLNISHSILRELRMVYCYCSKLVLNAPCLTNFEFVDSSASGISGEIVLDLLNKSCLHITDMCAPVVYVAIKLVSAVSHTRHLSISKFAIEAFQHCRQVLPTFHRLAILKVGRVSKLLLGLLPDLLNRCQLLKEIVFARGCDYAYTELNDADMICYETVPPCVLRGLKIIRFEKFKMRKFECMLVEYFLENAEVLENVKIVTNLGLKRQLEFSKKLSTFSQFSRDCQIEIYSADENGDTTDEFEERYEALLDLIEDSGDDGNEDSDDYIKFSSDTETEDSSDD